MLKLKEIREAYEDLSGKASDICRQLGYAGIGIIWIFNTTNDSISIPEKFQIPLLLICLSLTLDLLGYVIGTLIWYIIYLCKHQKNISDESSEYEDSECINMFTWVIWVLKIGIMISAYIILACKIFNFELY